MLMISAIRSFYSDVCETDIDGSLPCLQGRFNGSFACITSILERNVAASHLSLAEPLDFGHKLELSCEDK